MYKAYIGIYYPDASGTNAKGDIGNDTYCFKESKVVQLSSNSYSKTITSGSSFPSPIKIKITKKVASDFDQYGLMVYAAVPVAIKSFAPKNPYTKANLYVSNFLCVYIAK